MRQDDFHIFAQNILDIMDNMIFTGKQLLQAYQLHSESMQLYYSDLVASVACLKDAYLLIEENLQHSCYMQMLVNVDDTLLRLEVAFNNGNREKALVLVKYQLISFLLELKEEFLYWGVIYPSRDNMDRYYKNEFIANHENTYLKDSVPPYQVSIFIPVYNKLSYTKQCIESIYQNTDFTRYKCEFILINDGSTDDTEEYFESLGIQKVIHFKENVKVSIFTTAFRICEGEYFLFINNDTLVTPGWLDNLIACIQSDDKIISATPCTPNTSNYQADMYSTFPHEIAFLKSYQNIPNPTLWEERVRIMPVIALYRASILNKIGFADRLFYTLEFWDDDFSLRARRAGYRQVLCCDTYCYHFGSITGAEENAKKNTINEGKELFRFKNGVSAWSEGFCYDFNVLELIRQNSSEKKGNVHILGIDCGFGDMLLKLRDLFRKRGNETAVDSITSDERFYGDLSPISEQCICVSDLKSGIARLQSDRYDYVYVSPQINTYKNISSVITGIHSLLITEGILFFSIRNFFYEPGASADMNESSPLDKEPASYVNPLFLQQEVQKIFSRCTCIPVWRNNVSVEQRGQIEALEYLIYYCVK